MEIIKNTKLNDKKEWTFDAIIEALFDSKGVSLEKFQANRKLLVNLDNSVGADYTFDYAKYCEGEIGERIVIKQVAEVIFGEKVDPRPLTVPVRLKVLGAQVLSHAKNPENKQVDNVTVKVEVVSPAPEKSTLSFTPDQPAKKPFPLSFKLGK